MSTGSSIPRQTNPFHQFPLALLAIGDTPQSKLSSIIGYSTIDAGLKHEAIASAQERDKAQKFALTGYHQSQKLHRAWFYGKAMVNATFHANPAHCVQIYQDAKTFLDSFGPSPFVRIESTLLKETFDEVFPFRLFSILCAVYAIIGDKQYAIVRRDRVRAGALGYSKSSALFDPSGNVTPDGERLLSSRPDHARPLTLNQLRHSLNMLHRRKFFSRIHPWPKAKTVYYSRGHSHDELGDLIFKRIERKFTVPLAERTAQDRLMEKAAVLLKRLTSGASENAPDRHQTATREPPESHLFNTCCSNQCFPNPCSSNRRERETASSHADDAIGEVSPARWDELAQQAMRAAKGETP